MGRAATRTRAYEAWRARGVSADGTRRMAPGTVKPYVPPEVPAGKVNISDPDSRNLKAFRGYVQGYNAQAVVTEQQIVIAAEIKIDPTDFGYLGPMVDSRPPELLERRGSPISPMWSSLTRATGITSRWTSSPPTGSRC